MRNYAYLHSDVGLIEVVERAGEIISISFVKSQTHVSHTNILLDEAILQLRAYFDGNKIFNLPLNLSWCSKFEKDVYETLMNYVPYGKTVSYKELATLADHPNAYRAVGTAMAKNRFVIVIPCHRVIKEDGSLGHYSSPYGTKTKELLLNFEKLSNCT